MKTLLKAEPRGWKAGHLLNDNFGGLEIAENLTPLTTKANRNHATIEGHVKRFLKRAAAYAEANPEAPYVYGVKYRVNISPVKRALKGPLKHVTTELIVEWYPVRAENPPAKDQEGNNRWLVERVPPGGVPFQAPAGDTATIPNN